MLIKRGRDTNLATLMYEFAQMNPGAAPFQGFLLERLKGFLRRLRVSTNHIKDKNGKPKVQVKAIIGLGGGRAAKDIKFYCEEYTKEVTVAEYFKRSNTVPSSFLFFYAD